MKKLDIAECLARPSNENILKQAFCCEFPENALDYQDDEEHASFLRLYFDCRTGKLGLANFPLMESPLKQFYRAYGDDAVHFMPLVSYWINAAAPAFYDWDDIDLYTRKRMKAAGWDDWRREAEEYIKAEYERYTPKGYFS